MKNLQFMNNKLSIGHQILITNQQRIVVFVLLRSFRDRLEIRLILVQLKHTNQGSLIVFLNRELLHAKRHDIIEIRVAVQSLLFRTTIESKHFPRGILQGKQKAGGVFEIIPRSTMGDLVSHLGISS